MQTGFRGTFVIAWGQTSTDGNVGASPQQVGSGSQWRWTGEAQRVDGPGALLPLADAHHDADLRERAARRVRKLIGAVGGRAKDIDAIDVDGSLAERDFVVTDGRQTFTGSLVETAKGQSLAVFNNALPPRDTDLWVVDHRLEDGANGAAQATAQGIICFTPGTMIRTQDGARPVEALRPGDRVQTKDNGAQEILWRGARRITGARMQVMPELVPVRLRLGALGQDVPDADLVVSPDHRMVVRGRTALALFNAPEVLVAAKDIVNGKTILRDRGLREVTYIHLLLERHEVLWANGLETESFHPANMALHMLGADDRASLQAVMPDVADDPGSYGPYARRNLSNSEAALLKFRAA